MSKEPIVNSERDVANLVVRLRNDRDIARKERDDAKSDYAALQKQYVNMTFSRDVTASDRDAIRKERDDAKNECDSLHQKLATAKSDYDALQKQHEEMMFSLDVIVFDRNRIRQEHETATKRIADLKKRCVDLQAESKTHLIDSLRIHICEKCPKMIEERDKLIEEKKVLSEENHSLKQKTDQFEALVRKFTSVLQEAGISATKPIGGDDKEEDDIKLDGDDEEGNDDDLYDSEAGDSESEDSFDEFEDSVAQGEAAVGAAVSFAKTFVGLGGLVPFVYPDSVQQTIASELGKGKTAFDIFFGGQLHSFDFVKMIQTSQLGRKYAIREHGKKNSAAFVDLDGSLFPYEKSISDKVVEAIDQKKNITVDIGGASYIIDGTNKVQIRVSTCFSRRIEIISA